MSNAGIGAKLRALRGEKTRAEVAAAVGGSVSALQKYENGARVQRDQAKMDIAVYFGSTVEDFLTANRTKRAEAERRRSTMKLIKQIRGERELLRKMMEHLVEERASVDIDAAAKGFAYLCECSATHLLRLTGAAAMLAYAIAGILVIIVKAFRRSI